MNDCWTCTVVGTYADQAVNYVGALSDAMAPAATVLFTSIFSLWIVIRGIQISLGTFNIAELVKEGIFVVAAFTLLQGLGDGMVRFVYATSMTIMTGAARMVIIGSVDSVQVPESLSAYTVVLQQIIALKTIESKFYVATPCVCLISALGMVPVARIKVQYQM